MEGHESEDMSFGWEAVGEEEPAEDAKEGGHVVDVTSQENDHHSHVVNGNKSGV